MKGNKQQLIDQYDRMQNSIQPDAPYPVPDPNPDPRWAFENNYTIQEVINQLKEEENED